MVDPHPPARRSPQAVEALLCAPGTLHELEERVIDGRVYRVYKNLAAWPSLREFWIWAANTYHDKTYAVYNNERYTYAEVFEMSLKVAAMYQQEYNVRKGDRVGIVCRNTAHYLVAFWAIHLIGGVAVLINAWLPATLLWYCMEHTGCKLLILDHERAEMLESSIAQSSRKRAFLVLPHAESKRSWVGMEQWTDALEAFSEGSRARTMILDSGIQITPECNATVFFTSGTTGRPKGVLSTQRMFLTNVFNTQAASRRAALRRGEDLPSTPDGPQKGILISVPLFHVTGMTSLAMLATFDGYKIVLMKKWIPDEAVRLIQAENVGTAGGVPSMVLALLELAGPSFKLDSLNFGGAPSPPRLASDAARKLPQTLLSQGYGATETNSVATSVAGDDAHQAGVIGWPSPVNDVIIVKDDLKMPPGQTGEIWVRGPNVMKEYWGDSVATEKALTKDGFFKTGDLGLIDASGCVFLKDRIKDIIIRGGENIDSTAVEAALYTDSRLLDVGVVSVPDDRLGELVSAVVSVKPKYRSQVTENSLIALARTILPGFAVPVMVVVKDEPLARTESGKIIKGLLRQIAASAWKERNGRRLAKL